MFARTVTFLTLGPPSVLKLLGKAIMFSCLHVYLSIHYVTHFQYFIGIMNNSIGLYKQAFAQIMLTMASLDDASMQRPRPPLLPIPAALPPAPRVNNDPPPKFCKYCRKNNHVIEYSILVITELVPTILRNEAHPSLLG